MSARFLRSMVAFFSLLVLLPACGSDAGGGVADVDPWFVPGDVAAPEETTPDGPDVVAPVDGGAAEEDRYFLFFEWTGDSAEVPVGANHLFTVRLIDQDFVEVEGALISYALTAHDGGDAEVSPPYGQTGTNGTATVRFEPHTAAPATYTLEAGTDKADKIALDITVTPPVLGTLKLGVESEIGIALQNIQVNVAPAAQYPCSVFERNPTQAPEAPWSQQLLSLNSRVDYEDEAGLRVSVFVTADGPGGSLAATGCEDFLVPDGTELATVPLSLEVLRAAGNYDMTAVFDFTGAIPDNEWGEILQLILRGIDHPTELAADLIVMVVEAYAGTIVGGIVEAVFDVFIGPLDAIVNEWIENEAPDWLRDARTVLQDLVQIVRHFELLADLQIAKSYADGVVEGTESWVGLALYWRMDCPGQQYTPECRTEINLADIGDTQFPLDLIEGRWTGTILGFDQLFIGRHEIELNYGRLILYVLNEIILPELTGGEYHSLYDAATGWIDCAAIASNGGFVVEALEAVGISPGDIEGFCDDAVSFVFGPLEAYIYGLAASSNLSLTGTATLVDDDSDLSVDRIEEGVFEGTVQWFGGNQAPGDVSAQWRADRR